MSEHHTNRADAAMAFFILFAVFSAIAYGLSKVWWTIQRKTYERGHSNTAHRGLCPYCWIDLYVHYSQRVSLSFAGSDERLVPMLKTATQTWKRNSSQVHALIAKSDCSG